MEKSEATIAVDTQTVKPFDPEGSLYDLSTYWGRVKYFFNAFDSRTLLASDENIEEAREKIARWKEIKEGEKLFEGEKIPSDKDLWEAKKLVDSAVHPDSGDIIPKPCRMAAFVPMNIPLVGGIALSTNSLVWSLFWQWANQSYNAAVNYANRNKTGSEVSEFDLGINYGAATSVSMGVAAGFAYLLKQAKNVPKSLLPLLQAGVPYAAVAAAGCANIYLMRRNELEEGINIFDAEGNCVGKSRNAAEKGITQVMLQRGLILPGPIIFLPTLLMGRLAKIKDCHSLSSCIHLVNCCLPYRSKVYPKQSSREDDDRAIAYNRHNGSSTAYVCGDFSAAFFNRSWSIGGEIPLSSQ